MKPFHIVFSSESLEEIKRIIEWYKDINTQLGERFKNNLLDEIAAIKKFPYSRSFRYDEVRFAVVKQFPYAAHYTIDEENRLIKIQAVLGFSQDSATNWRMNF